MSSSIIEKEEGNNNISSNNENHNEISITKTINSLINDEKDLTKDHELLVMKLKNAKNKYNTNLKLFNKLTKSQIQTESSFDNIQLKISSLKKKQKLILGTITNEYFSYFKPMSQRIAPEIYNGFLLFVNFEGDKKDQINLVIQSKENLVNLLLGSVSYLKMISEIDIKQYNKKKEEILKIKQNKNDQIVFPFDTLYDFFSNLFEMIDIEKDLSIIKEKIDEINNEKNSEFIKLKSLESEIIKNDNQLKHMVKYLTNIRALLNKYQNLKIESPSIIKEFSQSIKELKNNEVSYSSKIVKTAPEPNFPRKSSKKNTTQSINHAKHVKNINTSSTSSNSKPGNREIFAKSVKTISTLSFTFNKNGRKGASDIRQPHQKLSFSTKKSCSTFGTKRSTPINTLNDHILDTIEHIKIPSKTSSSKQKLSNCLMKHSIKPPSEIKKLKNKSIISSITWTKSNTLNYTKQSEKSFKKEKNITNNTNTTNEGLVKSDSKDSLNMLEINSVCDELSVSPMSIMNPAKFNSNTTSTYAYRNNSYSLMKKDRDRFKNKFINFKIEKPVNMGGCCVSCT